jgi:hypothetical protein
MALTDDLTGHYNDGTDPPPVKIQASCFKHSIFKGKGLGVASVMQQVLRILKLYVFISFEQISDEICVCCIIG